MNVRHHLLSGLLLTAVPLSALPAPTVDTGPELLLTGDFNADDVTDLALIEKSTGLVRVALGTEDTVQWLPVQSSGMDAVTSAAAGRLYFTNRDTLVLADRFANRLVIHDTASPNDGDLPEEYPFNTFGPYLVAAANAIDEGDPSYEDFTFFTDLNFSGAIGREIFGVTGGGGNTVTFGQAIARAPSKAAGVPVEEGADEHLLVTVVPGPNDTIQIYDYTDSPSYPILGEVNDVAPNLCFTYGYFSEGLAQILFYSPGTNVIFVLDIDVDVNGFAAEIEMPIELGHVSPLIHDGQRAFLATNTDGTQAFVYTFDGNSDPEEVAAFEAPEGVSYVGPVPLVGQDGFLLLHASSETGKVVAVEAQVWNGSEYEAGEPVSAPGLFSNLQKANILLFQFEPFISDEPSLRFRLRAGDWTTDLSLAGPVAVAEFETFEDSETGLTNPDNQAFSFNPAATAPFFLVNQVEDDIALYNTSNEVGPLLSLISVDPVPGTYDSAQQVIVTASNPAASLTYRTSTNSTWQSVPASGQLPPTIATTTYYFVAFDGPEISQVETATYTLLGDFFERDSDLDGVPDFVEVENGLDPLAGEDTDLDGVTDRDELLYGTDPNLATSFPLDTDGDGYFDIDETNFGSDPTDPLSTPADPSARTYRLGQAFDLGIRPLARLASPSGFFPAQNEDVAGQTGAAVRAYDPFGVMLDSKLTRSVGLTGLADPAANLQGLTPEQERLFAVAATERNFDVQVAGDTRVGRELAGLYVPPVLNTDPVPFSPGGGTPAAEAAAWVTAARNYYTNVENPLVIDELDYRDTLALLVTEKILGDLMVERGILPGGPITLTAFRETEIPVDSDDYTGDPEESIVPSDEELLAVEDRLSLAEPGFLLRDVVTTVNDLVNSSSDSRVANLRLVGRDIYGISGSQANSNPGLFRSPLAALRQFIHDGTYEPGYESFRTATAGQRNSAAQACDFIRSQLLPRPWDTYTVEVEANAVSESCTLVRDQDTLNQLSLVNRNGDPFPFPDAFDVIPGSVLTVTGYADASSPCAANTVEVISIVFVSAPFPAANDQDGNLLYDEYEEIFGEGLEPFSDGDGDGYLLLQEMFEGTDGTDGNSFPEVPPVDLNLPLVNIEDLPGGGYRLSWSYPEPYDDLLSYGFLSFGVLSGSGQIVPGAVQDLGGGNYQLEIPDPGSERRFFALVLSLK